MMRVLKGLILLFCFVTHSMAQTMITKVIPLHYVKANTVIQLVKPLMQPNEKISAAGELLMVSVSAQTLTQIRAVLHQIDVPPVTFKISIYQGDANWLAQQNSHTVVYSTQNQAQAPRAQSVMVSSGESALVSTDQQMPIVSSVSAGILPGVSYQQHHIKNGFWVQPLLQGSQVKLTVKRLREQQNAAGGQQFDNQKLATTLMMPLDRWVALGSPDDSNTEQSSSIVYTAGQSFTSHSTLFIKITIVKNEKMNQ